MSQFIFSYPRSQTQATQEVVSVLEEPEEEVPYRPTQLVLFASEPSLVEEFTYQPVQEMSYKPRKTKEEVILEPLNRETLDWSDLQSLMWYPDLLKKYEDQYVQKLIEANPYKYIVVVRWEGNNQNDLTYTKYTFHTKEQMNRFVDCLNKYWECLDYEITHEVYMFNLFPYIIYAQ